MIQYPVDLKFRQQLVDICHSHFLVSDHNVGTFGPYRPLGVQEYQSIEGKLVEVGFTVTADANGGYLSYGLEYLRVF